MKNKGGAAGLMGSFANGIVTDNKWKCTTQAIRNWHLAGFDDSNWPAATVHGDNSGNLRVSRVASNAKWIGPSYRNAGGFYCRRRMTYFGEKPKVGGSELCFNQMNVLIKVLLHLIRVPRQQTLHFIFVLFY